MMNELYFATQRSATGLDVTGSKQWQEAVKAAKERNTGKQRGFYVTADAGVVETPVMAVDKEQAKFALGLARHHLQYDGACQSCVHVCANMTRMRRLRSTSVTRSWINHY